MSDKVSYSSSPFSSPTDFVFPFLNYFTTSSGQYGLINIRYGASSNAEKEQDIVENVAGYGKQIGRVLEATVFLADYLAQQDEKILADKTIKDLIDLHTDIQARKAMSVKKDALTLEQFIEDLSALKASDQKTFERVSEKLKAALSKLG